MKVILRKIKDRLVKIDSWFENLFISSCPACEKGKVKRISNERLGDLNVYKCDNCKSTIYF